MSGDKFLSDEEALRRQIEDYLVNAEDYIQNGQRHRALMEFEKAAVILEAAEQKDQLEQLWGHAATGFTAAGAPLQAGHSYLRLAQLEAKVERHTDARDSYLAAANAFITVREKSPDLWVTITQTVEHAIELATLLNDHSQAIDLLVKCASLHQQETGYKLDAIHCLERAQTLLEQVPNHPLGPDIRERLQYLLDHQSI